MSGYRFLTGRTRQIRYSGTYSYDYHLEVDLTQSGLHEKVGQVFSHVTGAFLGWAMPLRILKRALCRAGLDRPYTQTPGGFPSSYQMGFGPVYSHSGSSTAAIIEIRDRSTGAILESFDAGWNGVAAYDDAPGTGVDSVSGLAFSDAAGLYGTGPILTVTDTFSGSHSGSFGFTADVEEIARWFYTSTEANELEPGVAGTFPVNRAEYSEVLAIGGAFGWDGAATTTLARIPVPVDVYWPWCDMRCQAGGGLSASAGLAAAWDGGGYSQSPAAMSVSNAFGTATAATVTATSPGTPVKTSYSQSFFPVKWRYIGSADAVAFGGSIPDTSTVEWQAPGSYTSTGGFPLIRGGGGEFAFTYRRGTATAGFDVATGGGATTSVSSGSSSFIPTSQFGVRFSNASRAVVKPQVNLFCLRGPGWDQFTCYQEQYKYYAKDPWHAIMSLPLTTKGWYPGATVAITSISVVSGKLRIETSATGGSATDRSAVLKLLTERKEMRHVGIRIRSIGADNLPFTLRLGSEVFSSTTALDGVWVERMFDRYDTHFPLLDFTGIIPTDTMSEVAAQDLSVSSTYEVEWIRGERMDHSKLFSSGFLGFITDTLITRAETLKNIPSALVDLLPPAPVDTGDNPSSWVMTDIAPAPFDQPADIYDPFTPSATEYLDPPYHQNSTAGFWPFLDGLGFDGAVLDIDVAGPLNEATLRAYPLATFIGGYPGAGDILGGGAYGEDTNCNFHMVVRGQAFGPILGSGIGTQEVVITELTSGGADVMERGRGSADADGYYVTGAPYARAQTFFSNWVRVWLDDQQPTATSTKIPDGFRSWFLWRVTGEDSQCITIDTVRGWLHIGIQKKIRTYHVQTRTVAFGSADHPVDEWSKLASDARTGILYLLGIDGSDYPVYRSFDGGMSIEEVLRVTADSAAIVCDTNRGWIILLYEDGGDIQRQVSRDGGENWDAADTVLFDGSAEDGEVLDMTVDQRAVGQLALLASISGATKIYRSFDGGESWETSIS